MANSEYSNLSNFRQEIAVLQESINKYAPPTAAKFTIPALMGNTSVEKTIPNKSNNILNKNNNLGITKTTVSNYVTLAVPKEYVINYPEKYVPAGTMFIVGFIGGDITSAKIVGRYW